MEFSKKTYFKVAVGMNEVDWIYIEFYGQEPYRQIEIFRDGSVISIDKDSSPWFTESVLMESTLNEITESGGFIPIKKECFDKLWIENIESKIPPNWSSRNHNGDKA